MQDRPTATELVEAVREFLADDISPTLDGRLAFHLRVALNVLDVVARELTLGPGIDADQHDRLVALLGHDGDTTTLEAELASAIRAGDVDERDAAVLDHVRATVREKLLVTNPKYLEA